MTIKGKKSKTIRQWKELTPDFIVHNYLRDKVEFDSAIWYPYAHADGIKGYLLLPYKGGHWLEDKLWFTSQFNMNQFCMMCKCKTIMELD